MVTSGEAGIDGMHPDECRRVREAEEVESAQIVGVETVEFLGLPDGIVEYGVPLRRTLAEVIRRHRPEIVLTGNFRDTFGPGALNQADHIAVGRAVLDAARDAGNRWIFPDQLGAPDAEGGLEPWGGVRAVWAFGSPEARHGVDTTETFDAGRRVARRPRGVHRGAGLGELGPPRVPRGLRPADRASGLGVAVRDALRGLLAHAGAATTRTDRSRRVAWRRRRLDADLLERPAGPAAATEEAPSHVTRSGEPVLAGRGRFVTGCAASCNRG